MSTSSASASARVQGSVSFQLSDITCPVDIDHRAGHRCRRLEREIACGVGDFLGRGDAAERDVGEQFVAAAAFQIVPGHARHREAGADRESKHVLARSEEHTSELQSLMRISYAVFCLKKKNNNTIQSLTTQH